MNELTFSEVIKELRAKSQLNRKAFAGRIGVNPRTLKSWENGSEPPVYARHDLLEKAKSISSPVILPIRALTSHEDIKRFLSDIDAATTGERESVPYNLLIDALNQHCSPSVSIKLLDSIREDMGW